MNEIQNNLENERQALGLTQQDAAILIGVTRATYIKYENDLNTMPIGKYEQLKKELARLKELKNKEEE